MRKYELGAVDQTQTFFGRKYNRLQTMFLQSFTSGYYFVSIPNFSFANQWKKQVCQWSQIARSTYRTLFGNHWNDVSFYHQKNSFDHLSCNPRKTFGECMSFGNQH